MISPIQKSKFLYIFLIFYLSVNVINDRIIIFSRDHRLGILMIAGAKPEELHANWDHNNGTSLQLCVRQTCTIIKNWCNSINNRINRIEFIQKLPLSPIVIRNLDELECHKHNNDNQLIKELNRKFKIAQKQLLLINRNDESDHARLMRCAGCIISDIITRQPMYRLFDFKTVIDQIVFLHDNCPALFTRDNLDKLNFVDMGKMFRNRIKRFLLYENVQKEEEEAVEFLDKKFKIQCWEDFKSTLYNYHQNNTIDSSVFLSKCTGKS